MGDKRSLFSHVDSAMPPPRHRIHSLLVDQGGSKRHLTWRLRRELAVSSAMGTTERTPRVSPRSAGRAPRRAADDPSRTPHHRRNRCRTTTASTLNLARDRDKSVPLAANVCTIQCMDDVSPGAAERSPSKIPPHDQGRRQSPPRFSDSWSAPIRLSRPQPIPEPGEDAACRGSGLNRGAGSLGNNASSEQYDAVIDGLGGVRAFFESFATDELDTKP